MKQCNHAERAAVRGAPARGPAAGANYGIEGGRDPPAGPNDRVERTPSQVGDLGSE
jgi:hypothetical protein